MASCAKCGRAKISRDKQGRRKCKRCGVLPSNKHLDQGGTPRPPITCNEVSPQ